LWHGKSWSSFSWSGSHTPYNRTVVPTTHPQDTGAGVAMQCCQAVVVRVAPVVEKEALVVVMLALVVVMVAALEGNHTPPYSVEALTPHPLDRGAGVAV
jgi:hypothetical protein